MDKVELILERVTKRVSLIPGLLGIVLGGSRARGTNTEESDIDVGLYYESDEILDLPALNAAARELDDDSREDLVTPPGSWGNWVNGGGWLTIDTMHVDLILRDIRRVERATLDCTEGHVSSHYQPGHPHAYHNVMYMGELAVSRVLWDKGGAIGRLKSLTTPYPEALQKALIGFFSFEAGFSLTLAKDNAVREDLYYVSAHLVRAVSALNQVLFALNGEYCLNEKKAVKMIDGFCFHPADYKMRVERVFRLLGESAVNACGELEELAQEVKALGQ